MNQTRRLAALSLGIALFAVACKKGVEPPPKPTAISQTEADEFASAAEAAFGACNTPELIRLLDFDGMARTAASHSDLSPADQRGFLRGFLEAGTAGLAEQMCPWKQGNHVRHLRTELGDDGIARVFLRVVNDDGLNYIELQAGKSPTGRVRAHELLMFSTGEKLTDLVTNIVKTFLSANPADIERTASTFRRAGELMQAGDAEGALAAYNTLPASIKSSKAGHLMHVQIASGLAEELYGKAIAEFEKAYPGDPSLHLWRVERAVVDKELDKAMTAIDNLDKVVGGDPYLDVFRANVLVAQGKQLDRAKTLSKALITREPDLQDPHWTLLDIALLEKQHDQALASMTVLHDKFAVVFSEDAMRTEPSFAPFMASEQWLTNRAALQAP